jgi:hypothetical protein
VLTATLLLLAGLLLAAALVLLVRLLAAALLLAGTRVVRLARGLIGIVRIGHSRSPRGFHTAQEMNARN